MSWHLFELISFLSLDQPPLSCFLCDSGGGGLIAFGKNDYGQLGVGSVLETVFTPTRVVGSALESALVTKLACGYYHSVAVTEDGAVHTFGRNDYGQLGLGHTKHTARPMVGARLHHFCTVDLDGTESSFDHCL